MLCAACAAGAGRAPSGPDVASQRSGGTRSTARPPAPRRAAPPCAGARAPLRAPRLGPRAEPPLDARRGAPRGPASPRAGSGAEPRARPEARFLALSTANVADTARRFRDADDVAQARGLLPAARSLGGRHQQQLHVSFFLPMRTFEIRSQQVSPAKQCHGPQSQPRTGRAGRWAVVPLGPPHACPPPARRPPPRARFRVIPHAGGGGAQGLSSSGLFRSPRCPRGPSVLSRTAGCLPVDDNAVLSRKPCFSVPFIHRRALRLSSPVAVVNNAAVNGHSCLSESVSIIFG